MSRHKNDGSQFSKKSEGELELISNLEKYGTRNPFMKLALKYFFKSLSIMIKSTFPNRILDVGCGEGFFMGYLKEQNIGDAIVGIDVSSAALKIAKTQNPQLNFLRGSIYALPFKANSFDLLISMEVLEHLKTPKRAIYELKRVSQKYCVISVPNEPFFRLSNLLRGKDLIRLGNNPRHVYTWTKKGFVDLLKNYFEIKDIKTPFPWTIVLCKK